MSLEPILLLLQFKFFDRISLKLEQMNNHNIPLTCYNIFSVNLNQIFEGIPGNSLVEDN